MVRDMAWRSSEGRDGLVKIIIICLCDSRSESCVCRKDSLLAVGEVVEEGGAWLFRVRQRREGAAGLLARRGKGRQAAGGDFRARGPLPAATKRAFHADSWRAALCAGHHAVTQACFWGS